MLIKNAAFITSLAELRDFPGRGLPEVCLCGKSNVGKSSLINRIGHNKKLARTSGEPGKTRLVNLYNLNGELILVDLPGYGFARAPISEKDKWAKMIEGYLSGSGHIAHVLQLVDIRHEPTADDVTMVKYLRHYGLDITVLATKADKVSKAAWGRSVPVICRTLGVQPWEVVPFSAADGTGEQRVLDLFDTLLRSPEDA